MTLGQSIPVMGDWFILHFTENYGMAFGLEFSGQYGKLILSLFRIAAVIFIGWYLAKLVKKNSPTGLIICISLILAGALGNIIDSTFYGMIFSESYFNRIAVMFPDGGGYDTFLHGRVVDMFYFPVISGVYPSWVPYWGGQDFIFFRPVFNLADSAISTGVIILLIFQKRYFPHEHKKSESDSEPEVITAENVNAADADMDSPADNNKLMADDVANDQESTTTKPPSSPTKPIDPAS